MGGKELERIFIYDKGIKIKKANTSTNAGFYSVITSLIAARAIKTQEIEQQSHLWALI